MTKVGKVPKKPAARAKGKPMNNIKVGPERSTGLPGGGSESLDGKCVTRNRLVSGTRINKNRNRSNQLIGLI